MVHRAITACALVCLASAAVAQDVPPDVVELRRAHQADEIQRAPRQERARPRYVKPETLEPARYPWRCMGTSPWQNVYAEPSQGAAEIGLTQPQIAVTGDPVNGFLTILFYNGHIGYVPAAAVHEFSHPNNPGTTCTFAGLNPVGRPMFRFGSKDAAR